MTNLTTLNKMKKANKLVQLYFHKDGPRSYKRGVGALLSALAEKGEDTQRNLVVATGLSRHDLKNVVKKAARKGYVTIEDASVSKAYIVRLTTEGKEVAAKREKAHAKVADQIVSCLTEEEVAQLDAICEKLIIGAKDAGISGKKKGHKQHRKCRKQAQKQCKH